MGRLTLAGTAIALASALALATAGSAAAATNTPVLQAASATAAAPIQDQATRLTFAEHAQLRRATITHQVARRQLADHVTGYIDVLSSGRYEAVLVGPSGARQTSPVTFSSEAAAGRYLARTNDILKNFKGLAHETLRALHPSGPRFWSFNIWCAFTCGADSSGGDHFWVIASYQQIAGYAIAEFSTACAAYVSLETDGWGAVACGAVAIILRNLAANEPRVSNHGVWAAIYFSQPWSPQYGRY